MILRTDSTLLFYQTDFQWWWALVHVSISAYDVSLF